MAGYRGLGITEEGGDGGLLVVTRDNASGGIDSQAIAEKIRGALSL
jgi:hypothetical protein